MIKKATITQNRPDYAETPKLLPAAFVRSTHSPRERERERERERQTDRQTDREDRRQHRMELIDDCGAQTLNNRDRLTGNSY